MTTKASLYFHINNGGVTVAVEDRGHGPVVCMKASHVGHQTGRVSVGIRREHLKALGDLFHRAAGMGFSPDSVVAAEEPRDEMNRKPDGTFPAGNVAGGAVGIGQQIAK